MIFFFGLHSMALRIAVVLASLVALVSAQGVPRRPLPTAAGPTPVDFSLSAGAALSSAQAAAANYGWLQQPAVYTSCSTVASLGTWEAGNIWFQLQGDSTAYWLLQIDQVENLLPDFNTTLKSIEDSLWGDRSIQLQFGWLLDPTDRSVVVDFLAAAGSCP